MINGKVLRAAALSAAASFLSASVGVAGDCDALMKNVERAIDKVDPEKAGRNAPLKCAMFAEGLGMLKMFRVLSDECLDEGAKRTTALAELERTIRKAQQHIDKTCQ
jgi:hypothetical protein